MDRERSKVLKPIKSNKSSRSIVLSLKKDLNELPVFPQTYDNLMKFSFNIHVRSSNSLVPSTGANCALPGSYYHKTAIIFACWKCQKKKCQN